MSDQKFITQKEADDVEMGAQFAPKFDSAGLITCIVRDVETGEIVMVAHMNEDALAKTIATRIATYWSRSRAKLWVKGETSGHTQHVERLQVDCDQDVLLMSVRTDGTGANCHTGRKSCFYRDIALGGSPADATLSITGSDPLFDPKKVYK
ncbi:MAG: phosphoribosyl-AMP cyclohydrolase [Hyphomicrobiales bacterium]|nr:MAG: phosphoribosyl-AMP cyclohydrolase [Hyphomicrobiales bacterium]